MSKCHGFERSAHAGKVFHLQPGDIITPRYVQLASEGRVVFADQRELIVEREALRKANIAIERRERAQEREGMFWGWVKKIIG